MDNCKIVFLSNYYNHHQQFLSDALYRLTGGNYWFIETAPMTVERLQLGWGQSDSPLYVKLAYWEPEECQKLIDDADVVIIGSASEKWILHRKKQRKLILRYSERPLKKGMEMQKYGYRFVKWHWRNWPNGNIHMLCASAFTAADYHKFFMYRNRCYRWGYFPECKRYDDFDRIMAEKQPKSIIWVARMIDWKHPEACIALAKRLKDENYAFELNMIGGGALEQPLRQAIQNNHLEDCVHLLGAMTPEEVRTHMEKAEIFLFTSDRNEGWGAVLNEAMNSGCAAVASHAIGSVPFLLSDRENGLVYRDGDMEDLYQKVKWLLAHPAEREQLGRNAYSTITEQWNAEKAADRLIRLCRALLSGEKKPELFTDGVCSKAEVLQDDWYSKTETHYQ